MRAEPTKIQRLLIFFLWSVAFFTIGILIFIIGYILIKGLSYVDLKFLLTLPEKMGKEGGVWPFIFSTLYITSVCLVISVPLGVGTAIYLSEYTREGWFNSVIRFGCDCLAGIPSIILGLFGFIFFVIYLKMGWSVLAGGLTVSLMILPFVIRSSEEAIRAVPCALREASLSLGASRWQTVMRIVLPNALPGILTGIILGIGKCVGETASLILTAGSSLRLPVSIFDSGRTLAIHFYILAREGISMEKAYATAAVLIISILVINIAAYKLMHHFVKRYKRESIFWIRLQ
ncbi:TPA: phosphate ABC transporter permease PtsA [bacterium]|nr:phosphate ABC transporter permease PtsA [bacterium]